jgi:hypothetical protein
MDANGDQLPYYEGVTADRGTRKAPQSDFKNSPEFPFLLETCVTEVTRNRPPARGAQI